MFAKRNEMEPDAGRSYRENEQGGDAALQRPRPPAHTSRYLSEVVGDLYERMCAANNAADTCSEFRNAVFYLFEFLGSDPPIDVLRAKYLRAGQEEELLREGRPLPPNLMNELVDWLRRTPSRPRRPGTLPGEINPGTVKIFFTYPPKRKGGGRPRTEQTVAKYRRTLAKVFKTLGLASTLERSQRPCGDVASPLPPEPEEIAALWNHILIRSAHATARQKIWAHRTVLLQGLLLLTGARLDECLSATLDRLQDHWLIVDGKTGPRMIYINQQALQLAATLRGYCKRFQPFLFAEMGGPKQAPRFAGITFSESYVLGRFREAMAGFAGYRPEKPQQAMRQFCSTYMRHPNRPELADIPGEMLVAAEKVQLGHGGNVVEKHYLGALRLLPRILAPLCVPPTRGRWTMPRVEAGDGFAHELYAKLREMKRRRRTPIGFGR